MKSSAVTQVDLQINTNWNRLIDLFDSVNQKYKDNQLTDGIFVKEYNTMQYNFGELGCFISLDNLTDNPGESASLNGKILEHMLPCSQQIKHDLKDLDLVSMSILECTNDIHPHIDSQVQSDLPGQCRINYIIAGEDAVTFVDNDGQIESYRSIPGTAWLLDTTKLHWVKNSSRRHLFQLTFYQPYQTVLNWFNQHPQLIYNT
jgi:hypothetical protein